MQYSTHVKQYTFEALLSAAIVAAGWWLLDAPDRHRWRVCTVIAIITTLCSVGRFWSWRVRTQPGSGGLPAPQGTAARNRATLLNTRSSWARYLVAIKPESHPAPVGIAERRRVLWTKHGDASIARGFLLRRSITSLMGSRPCRLATIVILAAATVISFFRSTERAFSS